MYFTQENMLPSQLYTLADEARYNEDFNEDLTAIAYAMEFEDDCNVISDQALSDWYVNARHAREYYFG